MPARNPITGEVYEDGVIPQSAITPFASPVLGDLPTPTRSTNADAVPSNNWEYLTPTPWVDDKGDGRLDYYATSRLNLFGRYSQRELNRTDEQVVADVVGRLRLLHAGKCVLDDHLRAGDDRAAGVGYRTEDRRGVVLGKQEAGQK